MPRKNWTREETVIAFNVYCKIPFKESRASHPMIIKYAKIIGRSPAALNMKIGNFGRLDPALKAKGISGLVNGSKLEEVIWNDFHDNWEELAYESELLIQKFQAQQKPTQLIKTEGEDKLRLVKTRVNQRFFRSTILATYDAKCCVTQMSIPSLLVASHIVPWSQNKKERLNPRNGLCLNALHDQAFDKGYLTIFPDYRIKVSNQFLEASKNDFVRDSILKYDGKKMVLPERFVPDPTFLEYHNNVCFKK